MVRINQRVVVILIATVFVILLVVFFFVRRNLSNIENLITSIGEISVDNPSKDPKGDVIVPQHSIGFSGRGPELNYLRKQEN